MDSAANKWQILTILTAFWANFNQPRRTSVKTDACPEPCGRHAVILLGASRMPTCSADHLLVLPL